MKQLHLLYLLLLCCIFNTYTQTITIKNQVTKQPLEFVTITSKNPSTSAVTNTDGQADLSTFESAAEIYIRSLGYKTLLRSYAELKKNDFLVLLEPSPLNLDEVVISANRWQQTANDIPVKVTHISPKKIALQNPQTAADLLGISGKVFIQKSQQGGGSPIIRGFATNRLLYTVDGIRMNTAIFRGGNLQNVISLDPFVMENTEVLFGPGSVNYGSDAIGGVMSFQTLTPQLSLNKEPLIKGKAISRYSSANKEKTGHFDVNIGWKKWAIVSSFSAWDYDNLRQGSHGPDDYLKPYYVQRQDSTDVVITQDDPLLQIPSAYSQVNMMQKVRFKPNSNWDINYGFHYSETSPYGRYDRHNRMRNNLPRYAEWNYGPQKWMMNNLSIAHHSNTRFYDELVLQLAQQSFEESRIDRSLNKDGRSTQLEEVEAYSANLNLKKILGPHTFYYGAEFVSNDVTSSGSITDISTNISTSGTSRYPQSTWSSLAVFVNDAYDIHEKVSIQAGLRFNQYVLDADFSSNLDEYPFPFNKASIDNLALTGSIGGIYRPNESWAISTNLGTAFRSPNVDDIGKIFDSEPGAVTVPNPNLEAEYAYNIDVGVAKVFGKSIKLDLTAYYTILKEAMVRRNFQLNGQDSIMYAGSMSQVQAIQNAAEAEIYGLQAGIEVKLPAGFGFTTDLNYQVGEEELDDGSTSTSRHAAPFFGTSRLQYRTEQLKMEVYLVYQGERKYKDLPVSEQGKDEIYAKDSNGQNYAPSWYTLNVKARYALSEKMTVGAGIENISDQRYRSYSSGISGAGRNMVLSLTANF
jgi:hemoglobin/transferrin/lactoferrin receptor protein